MYSVHKFIAILFQKLIAQESNFFKYASMMKDIYNSGKSYNRISSLLKDTLLRPKTKKMY